MRPIAAGCTLRRLVAKCAGACGKEAMAALLAPHQLGFSVPLGAEAAVHASRIFLNNLQPGHLILKLDFWNAFNCLRRDKMIAAVKQLAPELLPLVTCAYSTPSFLFFGEDIIPSSEGVQQGDPLGPLLFCLAVHDLVQQLQSEFNIFFLDDGTLGGSLEGVLEDFSTVERMAGELGLQLNRDKSEVICDDSSTRSAMLRAVPGLSVTEQDHATLLGSPIGTASSIQNASTLTYSHPHVQLPPRTATPTYSYPHVQLPPRTATPTYSYPHVQLPPRTATPTYSHPHVQPPPRTATPTYSYPHVQLPPRTATPTYSYPHVQPPPRTACINSTTCSGVLLHIHSRLQVGEHHSTNL